MTTTELEQKIGYVFKDKSLLTKALTHSSYSNELRSRNVKAESNERLEFFGDAVLQLITSEYLFLSYPELPEGELSKIRSGTVSREPVAEYAEIFDLGNFLLLGKGEEKSGRDNQRTLCCTFEALLGAMYFDSSLEKVKEFLLPIVIPKIKEIVKSGSVHDYKTMLQTFVQQDKSDVLEYSLISEEGPAHDKTFEVAAFLNGNEIGSGKGKNKREAEQAAAKKALLLFGQISE